MALGSIVDPNKRKLVEIELAGMNYGDSPEEILTAVRKATDLVDAPFLRRVAQKSAEELKNDAQIASAGAGGSGRASKNEDGPNPEAKAIIEEARRQMRQSNPQPKK
jgi:hypothetical protein